MKISDIDKNFAVPVANEDGIAYYSPFEAPFEIDGLPEWKRNGNLSRLTKELQQNENLFWGVRSLCSCTAGGMIRFRTDSPVVAVKFTQPELYTHPNMCLIGAAGLDLYIGSGASKKYRASMLPAENGETAVRTLNVDEGFKEITINLPHYAGINEISIGIKEGHRLAAPKPFRVPHPICFYGSSITQGGCASHAGNTYTAVVGRVLDAEVINLGFSGSCKGELLMADYINTLELSAYVYDYDHNTPDVQFLKDTHRACYERVREHHRDLPIVILSKPDYHDYAPDDELRRRIIIETYEKAKARGDRVAFVDGKYIMDGPRKLDCTVDGCHPNDLGFYRMARKVVKALRELGV